MLLKHHWANTSNQVTAVLFKEIQSAVQWQIRKKGWLKLDLWCQQCLCRKVVQFIFWNSLQEHQAVPKAESQLRVGQFMCIFQGFQYFRPVSRMSWSEPGTQTSHRYTAMIGFHSLFLILPLVFQDVFFHYFCFIVTLTVLRGTEYVVKSERGGHAANGPGWSQTQDSEP